VRIGRPSGLALVSVVILACLWAPIAIVAINSVNSDERLISWGGFTTKWFGEALDDQRVRDAFVTSLQVALLSTIVSLAIAITASLWARRVSSRRRRMLDATTYMRIILPETVLAIGLFLLLRRYDVGLGVATIVIGHVVFNSAYATIIIQARLATMGPTLEEAAADLGANRWSVFRRITFPLLAPAVLVAGLLTLTFSFDDVIASQFLAGTEVTTLPVLLLGKIRIHVTPEVNAIGVGMMVITLTTFALVALVSILRPAGARGFIGFGRER
jgi:ABC-type spermidine/putrescine transport system permease subunit II